MRCNEHYQVRVERHALKIQKELGSFSNSLLKGVASFQQFVSEDLEEHIQTLEPPAAWTEPMFRLDHRLAEWTDQVVHR